MHTHSKKTIPAPGLAEMLASLGTNESGHPGEGWWSASGLANAAGLDRKTMCVRCNDLVAKGTYEKCRRVIDGHGTFFFRLKVVPGKCSTKANHVGLVRNSLPTHSPAGNGHPLRS